MPITQTSATGSGVTVTTATTGTSITVAAGDKITVWVGTDASARTVTSVVFNSGAQNLTFVGAQNQSSTARCEQWEITAPSAGTGTVTVNVNTAGIYAFAAVVTSGAATGAGYRDVIVKIAANSNTPSLTITSEVNDLAIAGLAIKNTSSAFTADGSPVSTVANVASGTGTSHVRLVVLAETGAASTSPSGTIAAARDWAMVGTNINIAPAASGGIVLDRRRRAEAAIYIMRMFGVIP